MGLLRGSKKEEVEEEDEFDEDKFEEDPWYRTDIRSKKKKGKKKDHPDDNWDGMNF